MSIVTNKDGDVLQKFIPIQQDELLSPQKFHPFTHSLIVLKYKDKKLLVYDRYRDRWEIPGGKIEPGETPRACVLRELKEETGQVPVDIHLVGVMQLYTRDKDHIVYGALYTGHQDVVMPFEENNEISRITYWDGRSDISYIDEIDRKLTELA